MNKKFILLISICFFTFIGVAFAQEINDVVEDIEDEVDELLFPDLAEESFYLEAVENMYNLGVIQGYENGTFGPNDSVTRAQAATMLDRYNNTLEYSNCSGELDKLNDEMTRIEEFYNSFAENPASPPAEESLNTTGAVCADYLNEVSKDKLYLSLCVNGNCESDILTELGCDDLAGIDLFIPKNDIALCEGSDEAARIAFPNENLNYIIREENDELVVIDDPDALKDYLMPFYTKDELFNYVIAYTRNFAAYSLGELVYGITEPEYLIDLKDITFSKIYKNGGSYKIYLFEKSCDDNKLKQNIYQVNPITGDVALSSSTDILNISEICN